MLITLIFLGKYKELIVSSGLVTTYDSYDGSPWIEKATNGNVKYLELTIPQYGLPLYDWIISLEVAEHIPAVYENVYLGNLIRHAKRGIILSWAVPGQGGIGHVNGQTASYVEEKMKTLCFDKDNDKSNELRQSATLPWLKQNMYVYIRDQNCTAKPTNA